MFRIGDFAQIAHVSGRLLRHYHQIGLLAPEHTDAATGYRYYSARQLPRLNRILALKSLGLTLDQIGRLLESDMPPDELRSMLALRQAEAEQALAAEVRRLREIESRIRQIEEQGAMLDYDVALRSAPERPWLSVRREFEDFADAVALLGRVFEGGTRRIADGLRDQLMVVAHSDLEDAEIDLEIGFALNRPTNRAVMLPGGLELTPATLEAVPTLATLVRAGPPHEIHMAYGALGVWMEANGYGFAGPPREAFLEPPFSGPDPTEVVVEVQIPVAAAA